MPGDSVEGSDFKVCIAAHGIASQGKNLPIQGKSPKSGVESPESPDSETVAKGRVQTLPGIQGNKRQIRVKHDRRLQDTKFTNRLRTSKADKHFEVKKMRAPWLLMY